MKRNICIAVDGNAKDKDIIDVAYFKCNASKKKVAASGGLMVAFSPFADNSVLKMESSTTSPIKVKELRADEDLTATGNCPACNSVHFLDKAQAADLLQSGDSLHCTLCSTQYDPLFSPEFIASLDEDEDDGDNGEDEEVTAAEGDESSDEEDNSSEDDAEELPVQNAENTETNTNVEEKDAFDNTHETGNDITNDGEIVTANTHEFVIDCLASSNGLSNKALSLTLVSPKLALVLADDMPVLRLFSEKAGDNAKLFNSVATLASAVQAIVEAKSEDFSTLGGEAISFTVNVDDQVNKKINDGVFAATASFNEDRTTLLEEVLAASVIASNIISKNVDRDLPNPIRHALIDELSKRNMQPTAAAQIADAVMSASANEYTQAVYKKTQELMAKPLAIRNEMGQFITKSSYVNMPIAEDTQKEKIRKEFVDNLASNSISISTTASTRSLNPMASNDAPISGVDNFRRLFKSR